MKIPSVLKYNIFLFNWGNSNCFITEESFKNPVVVHIHHSLSESLCILYLYLHIHIILWIMNKQKTLCCISKKMFKSTRMGLFFFFFCKLFFTGHKYNRKYSSFLQFPIMGSEISLILNLYYPRKLSLAVISECKV